MDWFVTVFKRYAKFEGRAGRPEYWWFTLIYFGISILLSVIDGIVGTFGILSLLFALALFVPALAVTVRRLHDTDRSGWWILVGFIPFIGWLVLLVLMILQGSAGANRFGEGPAPSL